MHKPKIRWLMVFYDFWILFAVSLLLLYFYQGMAALSFLEVLPHVALIGIWTFVIRVLGGVYSLIWRYGGIQCYVRLIGVDTLAFIPILLMEQLLPLAPISFTRLVAVCSMNLLGSLTARMIYRYAFKFGDSVTPLGQFLNLLVRIFAGSHVITAKRTEFQKIKVAIIGAGRTGVALAEDLLNNQSSVYTPRCFVDTSPFKVNRQIFNLPVFSETEATFARLNELDVQEVVFAIPGLEETKKQQLYRLYSEAGYAVKVYDAPVLSSGSKKSQLRMYDIEDLLFRKSVNVRDAQTDAYYRDKVILITGGGGSIGSELCRQLASMSPKQIIILDIYENGAYDVQQELRIAYKDKLNLQIEIVSICNRVGMERVFQTYRPQIVINAAAHKHVPLMEHNCIEAVENNIFGCQVLIGLCEQYGTERFMMVSTDKAVNPTNVMGATKRMCEMMVQSASTWGNVKYSATRFGNVLGSAGSVIPLFRKQIASGGPLTITDKRIIRYFMTIPEASQLVLQSGAMAKNGELFVLDMGKPVKILDLAENLIRLSGATGIEILETGLRPGEKLYEELLVNTDTLDKTKNSLIFIERDTALPREDLEKSLEALRLACDSGDNDRVKQALKAAVPTYRAPEEINKAFPV